ncbi:cytochrome P450, partial [Streptomyces sp. NPDC127044]
VGHREFDPGPAFRGHRHAGHGLHATGQYQVLPALFDRFPDLRLAVPASDLEPVDSFISNGHRTLPARIN